MRWNDNRNVWTSILRIAKRGCASVGKQLSMASAVAALGLTLSLGTGCFDTTVNPLPDADGDGFLEGDDCDDSDPEINPDALEICGDGVDQDCDGEVDGPECYVINYFYDEDGDGWGEGFGPGPDCNDMDASIHPEAMEICGDGIDQNCDGADLLCEEISCSDVCDGTVTPPVDFPIACNCFYDEDGDGYGSGFGPGPDCDDTDPTIHPDAPEVCGDGIDQDCDGFDVMCGVDADGDGYAAFEDCNDADPSVHPGAPEEICPDGVDQNCDGVDGDPGIICNGMLDVEDLMSIDTDSEVA